MHNNQQNHIRNCTHSYTGSSGNSEEERSAANIITRRHPPAGTDSGTCSAHHIQTVCWEEAAGTAAALRCRDGESEGEVRATRLKHAECRKLLSAGGGCCLQDLRTPLEAAAVQGRGSPQRRSVSQGNRLHT
ncbi:hypothetical protein JOQ06_030149, partial [Pogonophryne albipinna]